MTTIDPLCVGTVGGGVNLYAGAAPVSYRSVPATSGNALLGIVFGPESALASDTRARLVSRVRDSKTFRDGDPARLCRHGWTVKFSVRPVRYQVVNAPARSSSWDFVDGLLPRGTACNISELLMKFGHQFNEDDDAAGLKHLDSELSMAKANAFALRFYACASEGPLSGKEAG